MDDCHYCGLSGSECRCSLYKLEERISILEDGLDKLTWVAKEISDHIRNL